MSYPLQQIRKIVPWYAKFGLKIVRGILPLNYSIFAKMGFFRHGTMDNPTYAIEIFNKHFPDANEIPKVPFVFLEIGPGDSLFSGIIASSKGAKKSYLIDYGDYVSKDIHKYRELIEILYGADYLAKLKLNDINDIKKHFNIEHLVMGLTSIRTLPENSVDLSFSNACFEHVYANEVQDYFREIRRVSKKGSISSHCIDFKDHLAYSLNNLRFSQKFWETSLVKKSGIYTNRMRLSEMKNVVTKAGFNCEVTQVEKWDRLPVPVEKLHEDFKSYKIEDLLVKVAWLRLT